jgi:hypothetical protein
MSAQAPEGQRAHLGLSCREAFAGLSADLMVERSHLVTGGPVVPTLAVALSVVPLRHEALLEALREVEGVDVVGKSPHQLARVRRLCSDIALSEVAHPR